jgi:hypothetical protein
VVCVNSRSRIGSRSRNRSLGGLWDPPLLLLVYNDGMGVGVREGVGVGVGVGV